jgi:hypothetical protein
MPVVEQQMLEGLQVQKEGLSITSLLVGQIQECLEEMLKSPEES